jgi:hypothetical protein
MERVQQIGSENRWMKPHLDPVIIVHFLNVRLIRTALCLQRDNHSCDPDSILKLQPVTSYKQETFAGMAESSTRN